VTDVVRPTRRLLADQAGIAEAAAILRAGGLVAFPTETVYGLGANALDASAAAGIFQAKGRPASDPLIVHLAQPDDLPRVTHDIPPPAYRLAAAFWPGPLTLVLPRAAAVPALISAGRPTVAVRVPVHPVAQALIAAAGTPIAAPSANRFGHTSPTSAAHVLADLDGRIDMVLDDGPSPIGLESTVLDLSSEPPLLLRPGGISLEQLRDLIGVVELAPRVLAEHEALPGPGMMERHYAPDSELQLCIGPPDSARAWLRRSCVELLAAGGRPGLLLADEDAAQFSDLAVDIEYLGSVADLAGVARRLYAALRALDERRPAVLLARDFGEVGIARAIRDRLMRAASGKVTWL
jgi:L-threonylcarbamoyladenylate synthase